VNQDNTVRIANRTLQIEKTKWRNTLFAQVSRAGVRTLGWHVECLLRAAPGRPLCARRVALPECRIDFAGERKCPHPPRDFLSPPPHRRKKGQILEPDRSRANRTGHLDVLTIGAREIA